MQLRTSVNSIHFHFVPVKRKSPTDHEESERRRQQQQQQHRRDESSAKVARLDLIEAAVQTDFRSVAFGTAAAEAEVTTTKGPKQNGPREEDKEEEHQQEQTGRGEKKEEERMEVKRLTCR